MKTLLKAPIAFMLGMLAAAIIGKYKPLVVMVTGSVGKTSTKDAVAAALSAKFVLWASEKSYNSEFGVPLTIIGAKNPWTNPVAWIHVFIRGLKLLILSQSYPKVLVLEVGADRPGDLSRILRFVSPSAVVVTRLPEVPVHVEAYASPDAVRDEEYAPARALCPGMPLVVSSDDAHALLRAKKGDAAVYTFGQGGEAEVRIVAIRVYEEAGRAAGMEAVVMVLGKEVTLRAPGALGRAQVFAPVAALTLALALGLTIAEAQKGLAKYVPPPGRARIFKGKEGSLIIDDSYNASPAAVEEILRSLKDIPHTGRRIAVLGDMLELGRYSVSEHERIGREAAFTADVVVSVGTRARSIASAARAAGCKEVLEFNTADEAAEALPAHIQAGDVVLVKGSQSIRTECIVVALLEDAADVHRLVRQEAEWKKR